MNADINNNVQQANLTLVLGDVGIQAVLLYENKSINRTYVLEDFLSIDLYDENNANNISVILQSFLQKLSVKWGWSFFDVITSGSAKIYSIQNLATEGAGLTRLSAIINKDNPDYKKFEKFLIKFGYEDVLWLDLNKHSIKLKRFSFKNVKENLANIHLPKFDFHTGAREYVSMSDLMDLPEGKEFKAFLTLIGNQQHIHHHWINFINNFNPFDKSPLTSDLLRTFIIANLISLFNEHKNNLKNLFGDKKSLLWIEGSLINIIPQSILYSTIVDAFQLKGDFDIVSSFMNEASVLFEDWNQKDLSWNGWGKMIDFIQYSTAENIHQEKSHKVFLRSTLHRKDGSREMLYAMTDKINVLAIKGFQGILEFRNSNNELIYTVDFKKEPFPVSKYIVDSRFRPIIYGPKAKDNKDKFNKWFDDFNI